MMNRLNQASNVLYLSNFPKRTTKQDLEKLLEPCGELVSVNIIQKPQYAFAFVQFDDIRDAAYAIKELDQKVYNGMNLKIQFKNRKNKENQYNFQKNTNKMQRNDNIASPIQTNASLPLQKQNLDIKIQQSQRYQKDKEQNCKNKNNKYAVRSEYSQSGSRSRSKGNKENKNKYSNSFEHKHRKPTYKQREQCRSQSIQKYHSHTRNQHSRYATQYDVGKMYEIIKSLERNLRKVQEKLSDFLYDYKHSSNFSPSRRR